MEDSDPVTRPSADDPAKSSSGPRANLSPTFERRFWLVVRWLVVVLILWIVLPFIREYVPAAYVSSALIVGLFVLLVIWSYRQPR